MHGAAVTLARRFAEIRRPGLLVATDMLDLAAFLALARRGCGDVPVLLYMHENQITYPLPADPERGPMRRQAGERDRHYGFVNFSSMLAADRVAFNSAYHRDELLTALPAFLRHFPDHREVERVAEIAARSLVLPVGLELEGVPSPERASRGGGGPPLLLWNQRWEYDKDPAALMRVLQRLSRSGPDFRLALCGQTYGRRPRSLESGIEALGERVIHAGHLSRGRYLEMLGRADVVLSTARHEFFGVAVAEAVAAGAFPLVPARLAYPEVLPAEVHPACLYRDEDDLLERLRERLSSPERARRGAEPIARWVRERFDWQSLASRYDDLADDMCARHGAFAGTSGRP